MSARTAAAEPADTARSAGILTDLRATGDSSVAVPEPAPSAPRRKVNPQTLVLALVLTASGAALYMMRRTGMRGGLTFQKTLDAQDLDKVRGKSSAEERRILADLARSTAIADAPAEKIDKNPFILVGDEVKPLSGPDPEADARARAERERAEREKQDEQIKTRLADIHLTSVMEGPTPVAYVNGGLVKVGDIVEDYFTVAQIHDRSIELLAGGRTYTIQMSDGAAAPGMRRPGRPSGVPGVPAALR